jgi:hypothetical protein
MKHSSLVPIHKSIVCEVQWGGKVKNREEWRLIVQEAKAHPEL